MSTIVLRSVKGSGLTNNEIDANFTNLNTDKIEATQTVTLTNKTLALGSNTISGTTAQFNTALTDGDFATLAGTETLTNKTLTSPAINGGVIDTTSTTATAALGTSSTRLANTAFVQQEKEYLPALSQSLHIGAVVKAIVYDTSKDSDGGAWRKRCADKSWYTETLGGDRWIGQHATIAAAWTAAGSTTGAVYQASATAGAQTSGLYYTPTSSTTVTQVYRGVTREFPAVAGIVAESARVVIYDLATGAMWMVFNRGGDLHLFSGNVTCVSARDGLLAVGENTTGALSLINFVADLGYFRLTTTSRYSAGRISLRNTSNPLIEVGVLAALVNRDINDVAITVLDSSPIDAATGLPVPTIAVATAGGVSVIKDDGTVVTISSWGVATKGVAYCKDGRLFLVRGDSGPKQITVVPVGSTVANGGDYIYNSTSKPALMEGTISTNVSGAVSGANLSVGSTRGVELIKENPATPTKGMVAYVTTAYNSGHMVGDIRGAYLADTTAETVTASGELVTNGTFATDTSGWTAGGGATLAVVSGELTVTNVGATNGSAYQSFATVIGKTYRVDVDAKSSNAASVNLYVGNSANNNALGAASTTSVVMVKLSFNFIATAATTFVTLLNFASGTLVSTWDNISVKLAEPDRSVKNKGLVINGSLTKTAVASGAGLVAWSGFSAANYLEQPYNSDLDFGTGDFCVMGWVNPTSFAAASPMFHRSIPATAGGVLIQTIATTGLITVYGTASTAYTLLLTSTVAPTLNAWSLLEVKRLSGVLTISLNGISVGSVADSTNLTYATAAARLGLRGASAEAYVGSLALWRISATAPSADQIAHIYRTELPLFQTSAQCTIAGSSTAVTALAYDDTSELLHVGTSWGRTGFKDLLRVDSEATTTGALTSLSASQGVIITGGTSGKVYVPAMLLRDELRRKDEARKALGKVPVFQEFDAVTSQVAFVVAKGYTVKAVYSAGTLKRIGSTKDYTISDDGFQETITFAVAPGNTVWVSAMTVRK